MLDNSLAANTKKAYIVGLERFSEFKRQYGLSDAWPPTVEQVVRFVAWLSLQKLSHKTAKSYLSSIAFHCKLLDVVDPTKKFIVSKMVEGMQKDKKTHDNRLPITLSLLQGIVSKLNIVCSSVYEAKLFTAAFMLAFFGFLRVGEIAVPKKGDSILQAAVLAIEDLQFDHNGVIISIRHSKTDQLGKGVALKITRSNSEFCPVVCLNQYLHVRPQGPGPLFLHFNKQPITRYQFSAILKKTVSLLGLNYGSYKSHSFRIGAATEASQLGYSVEIIKKAGRWASNAYQTYVRPVPVVMPSLINNPH